MLPTALRRHLNEFIFKLSIIYNAAVKNNEGKYYTDHLTCLYFLSCLCGFDFATLPLGILH